MIKTLILLASIFQAHCSPLVIYGNDDRGEVRSADPKYQRVALSVAAQIPKKEFQLFSFPNEYRFKKSKNLERVFNLEKNQRFASQETRVKCSSFLVAPNIIATAGHCIKSMSDCEDNYWVFDYLLEPGESKINSAPKHNVATCKRIIKTKLDVFQDFALIEINETQNRPILELESQIKENDKIYMLGFPSGLPMKVTNNAQILKLFDLHFNANLDAFSINSGSPVLSENSDKVIGILVSGNIDYVHQSTSPKFIPNECEEFGKYCLSTKNSLGEGISRVNQFIDYL